MKKICYIVTIPLTIRAFLIPQLKYLAENGLDVSVICSSDETLQEELGDNIHFIPVDMPRGISFGGSVKAIRELKRVFKREKFDLIQYSTPNAAFYASIAAKQLNQPVRNYHLMGYRYGASEGIKRAILKSIEKIACNNSTHIECVSPSNLEFGVDEGLFHRDKAVVVWNGSTGGVDLDRFDYSKRVEYREEVRDRLGLSEEDFVFGFAGRITKDKGIDELFEAFFMLDDGSKLLLVGDYENKEGLDNDLVRKAEESNKVIIHEAVADIEKYYPAMDVLVLPSYREGFGNVVIEAGAMGVPAIVSDIPGPVDVVINGETAVIVTPKDSKSLATAMLAIGHKEAERLGMAALDYVRCNFDSDKLNWHILNRKKELLGDLDR